MMRAIIANLNEPLVIGEYENPKPNDFEVLIRVHAAGINRPDLLQRAGLYPAPKNASPLLGLEVAGEIIAIGNMVTKWAIGDKVCALLNGGGYAEFAVAHEGFCFKIPNSMSMIEAASLPETIMTVYTNVFDACALKAGENFMVHGGASGIGTMAIQMAKAKGAKTFATAGGQEKADFCKKLGADIIIDYKTEDFETIARENGGIDVILDMVGGDYVQKNLNILNEFGRLCQIAFLKGSKCELNLMRLMLKRLNITGSTLRSRSDKEKIAVADGVKKDFWPLVENGTIKAVIDSVFDFENAEQAHAKMQANTHMGKIILKII